MKIQTQLASQIDLVLSTHGYKKKGKNWHLANDDVSVVVNLQKSQYEDLFFINCGFMIRELCDTTTPAEEKCHVSFRADSLFLSSDIQSTSLFDFDQYPVLDDRRKTRILAFFSDTVVPFMHRGMSLEGLQSIIHNTPHISIMRDAWGHLDYSISD